MAGLGLSDAVGSAIGIMDGKKDRAFQDEQRGQQRKQWADADRQRTIEEEARAAGRAVFEGAQKQAGMGLSAVDNYTQRGGTDGSMPDQSGIDAAPKPTPMKLSPKVVTDAYDAAANVYLKNGDYQGFTKKFAESAAARTQFRNAALDDAMKSYSVDRDLGKLAKTAYGAVNDGVDIAEVVKVAGVRQLGADNQVDPAQSVPASLSFKLSDGTMTPPMTEKQVLEQIQYARMNPEKVLELEYRHRLTQAEIAARKDSDLAGIRERGKETRLTLGDKNAGNLDAIDRRTEGSLAQVEARGRTAEKVATIRASGTISAAQIRKAAGGGGRGGGLGDGDRVQSTKTDADGNLTLIMKSGDVKKPVNDDGTPMKTLDYQRLVGSTAAAIGKAETDGRDYGKNREAAKKSLGEGKPAAGGKDYSGLWSK